MWYLILAFLLGLGNPFGTGSNGPVIIQTVDDGGDEGEEGSIIPPIPPKPIKP